MFRRTMVGPLLVALAVLVGVLFIGGVLPGGSPATASPGPSAGASPSVAQTAAASPSAGAPGPGTSASPPAQPSPAPSAASTPGPSGSPTAVSPDLALRLQVALDAYATKYRLPGASVTITWPDGRAWTGVTGFADLKAARRVTPDTVFAIASMSKTFTSALILGLVDDGKLSLDRKVATLLPSVRLGTPGTPIPAAITVRMLLDHTSGLADFFFGKGIDAALNAARGTTWTPERALAYVGKPLGPAGRSWHYSNTNYVLLGLVAEKVGGAPFATLVRQRLFGPFGLTTASIQGVERARGPLAMGYRYASSAPGARPILLADPSRLIVPFTSVVTAAGSAGDVAATSGDLASWARALYGGRVLKPDTLAQAEADWRATAPYRPYVAYGLGVQVSKVDGYRAYGHSGRFIGVRGELRYLPAVGLAFAILVNQNGVDIRPLTAKLVTIALALPPVSIPGQSPVPSPSSAP
jgi:D-alanyl-D-alanine carboxypeptidase